MSLIDDLLVGLPDGEVLDVRIGIHWTAVVVMVNGQRRCGLSSTLTQPHEHHGTPDVPTAGSLTALAGRELAEWIRSDQPTLASIGVAALNALLPSSPDMWFERNAEEVIAQLGVGRQVALVGSFPFAARLRERVGTLVVLDGRPGPGEYPPDAAPELLPGADVVAITGMTLINHTIDDLLALRKDDATVLVLGPSTPLSPAMFGHGVDVLSGAVVTDIDRVLCTVSQGATFRQVRRAGVRLVTMKRAGRGLPRQE